MGTTREQPDPKSKVGSSRKKQPSKYSHVAEIKSSNDNSRPASAMHVRLLNPGQSKGVTGACIHSTVPYIRDPIPVVILFRALGFVADKYFLLRYYKKPPMYGPELADAVAQTLPYATVVHLVGALATWSNRDITRAGDFLPSMKEALPEFLSGLLLSNTWPLGLLALIFFGQIVLIDVLLLLNKLNHVVQNF